MALRTASINVGDGVKSIRYLTADDGNIHVHARDLMHASGSETQASATRRLRACSPDPQSAMSLGFVHAGVDKDLSIAKEAVLHALERGKVQGAIEALCAWPCCAKYTARTWGALTATPTFQMTKFHWPLRSVGHRFR